MRRREGSRATLGRQAFQTAKRRGGRRRKGGVPDPHPAGGTPKRLHAHPRLYILFHTNDLSAFIDPLPTDFCAPAPVFVSQNTPPIFF